MAKLDKESVHLLDDARLIAALKRSLALNAESLFDAAMLYAEARARHLDLSWVGAEIETALSLVADDRLAPEAALAFGRSQKRLRLVSTLSKADQLKLATGAPIDVVVQRQGREKTEKVPGHRLSNAQLSTAIACGKILSPFEQRALLKQRSEHSVLPARRRVSIDLAEDAHSRLLHLADRKKLPLGVYIVELLEWALQGQELGDTLGADKSEGGAA